MNGAFRLYEHPLSCALVTFQVRAEQTFGIASAVNVRMVKEIDPVVNRAVNDSVCPFLIKACHSHTAQRDCGCGDLSAYRDMFHHNLPGQPLFLMSSVHP